MPAAPTYLITGGGTGLGREIGRQAAERGANVAIGYSRSVEEAEATARELSRGGVQAVALAADLAVPGEADALVRKVVEEFGRLDVLVNNAGYTRSVAFGDLDGVTTEDWDRTLAINTRAPFELARAAAPELRRNRGSIVNVGSIAGLRAAGSSIPYCVSKAALGHLTHCLAVALAPEVRVNTVAPGVMETRWTAALSDQMEALAASALLEQTTAVADVAAAVIATAGNAGITGQTIVVDSGIVLH